MKKTVLEAVACQNSGSQNGALIATSKSFQWNSKFSPSIFFPQLKSHCLNPHEDNPICVPSSTNKYHKLQNGQAMDAEWEVPRSRVETILWFDNQRKLGN